MAQGTVTDYFPKRRKASLVPPSKRAKTGSKQDNTRTISNDNQLQEVNQATDVERTPSAKQSSRNLRTTTIKNASVNGNLTKYFQGAVSKKDDASVGTDKFSSPAEADTEKSKHKSQKQAIFSVDSAIVQNICKEIDADRKIKRGVRRKLSSEEYDDSSKLTCDDENGQTSVTSGGIDARRKLSSLEERVQRRNITVSQNSSKNLKNPIEKSKILAEKLLAKETSESLREKLKSKGNLKSLQESLMELHRMKKRQKGLKTEEAQKHKAETRAEMPKTISATEKREFAYETLHSLGQTIPDGLPLPFKWQLLAEIFRCMDVVSSMLFNRQQIITWKNLQKSVQEMVRKNFDLRHLAQIKTVFPTAYQYRQEKGIACDNEHKKLNEYQLTVEPMFKEEDYFGGEKKLTSGLLTKRRHHFHVQLINIVHEHHKAFLSRLSPPIVVPADKKIHRWHPQFPLDNVPDLDEADLPLPPEEDKKCSSAKDVLEKARSRLTKRAVEALKKVAEKVSSTQDKCDFSSEENNNELPKIEQQTQSPSLPPIKGVSQSLLAKVRAREAEKKLKSMMRSEEKCKQIQILSKLPDIARALKMLYTSEKKGTLPSEYICEKLVNCCTGVMSEVSVKEHIMLLVECVPSWLSNIKVKNVSYIKMNRTEEMNVVLHQLQAKRKEAETSV